MQISREAEIVVETTEVVESPRGSSLSQVRFRSASKTETDEEEYLSGKGREGKMRRNRQETLTEKLHRYRGVVIVISIPIALISFVLLLMPRTIDQSVGGGGAEDVFDRSTITGTALTNNRYSVIFDAGSSGSRVHVFCFDKNVDLVHMEDGKLELFEQIKPGLSNYSDNPKKGAQSLNGLLKKALDLVPKELHASTPVRLGATAGLRMLPGDTSTKILTEVKLLLHNSGFKFDDEWVSILDGADEGTYQWVTALFCFP
jgi:apyrase